MPNMQTRAKLAAAIENPEYSAAGRMLSNSAHKNPNMARFNKSV